MKQSHLNRLLVILIITFSFSNIYSQKHGSYSYGYKLLRVDGFNTMIVHEISSKNFIGDNMTRHIYSYGYNSFGDSYTRLPLGTFFFAGLLSTRLGRLITNEDITLFDNAPMGGQLSSFLNNDNELSISPYFDVITEIINKSSSESKTLYLTPSVGLDFKVPILSSENSVLTIGATIDYLLRLDFFASEKLSKLKAYNGFSRGISIELFLFN